MAAVSRLQSGRAIWLSQLPGDVALRVARDRVAIEVLDTGRRFRIEISDITECVTSVDEDDDRKLECGACGLRFGARRHLDSHADFHDKSVPPAPTTSGRVRLVLGDATPVEWRKETAVDPTSCSPWTGTRALWAPVAPFEDPLVDEVRRTRVVTMRLRSQEPPAALVRLAETIRDRQGNSVDADAPSTFGESLAASPGGISLSVEERPGS